jgi:uncharacterized protein involved in exopolysaccharide biosynthesis
MLEDVYRSIARQWRVFAAVTVLITVCAVALGVLWPDRYTARASVTVEAIPSAQGSAPDVNMETQRLIAQSTGVLSLAVEELGDTTVVRLRDDLEVAVPRESQVLEFSVTTGDAEESAETANAIASAYLAQRTSVAQARITEASEALTATADEIAAQLAALEPDNPLRSSLESQIRALQAQRAALIATSFTAGSLIDPAAVPREANTPSLLVFGAAGVFLGLLVGAFAALIWDRVSRARRRPAAAHADADVDAKPTVARDSGVSAS